MLIAKSRPDHIDCTSALRRYTKSRNYQRALLVAKFVVKNIDNFAKPDVYLANHVLSVFQRLRLIAESEGWLETMKRKFGANPEAYSSMILLYMGMILLVHILTWLDMDLIGKALELTHQVLSDPKTFGEFGKLPKLIRNRISVFVATKFHFRRGVMSYKTILTYLGDL